MKYAQQLFTKVREKRYPSFFDSPDIRGEALEDNISEKGISPELLALWDDVQKEKDDQNQNSQIKRDTQKAARRTEFNDNLWGKQWYMVSPCTKTIKFEVGDFQMILSYNIIVFKLFGCIDLIVAL